MPEGTLGRQKAPAPHPGINGVWRRGLFGVVLANLCAMTKRASRDPLYKAIPEEFLDCLMSRRHEWPLLRNQRRQNVIIRWGTGKADVLDTTEYYATCSRCGTERTLVQDRYTRRFLGASYVHPEGYRPPPGHKWDRGALWSEYDARFPVRGKAEVRDRRPN